MTEQTTHFGVVLPGGTATQQLDQAVLAERSGWDGVFVWETTHGVDAWSLLAAMAVRTTRVRLGTMLTPLPWRRPWTVADQVATVDQLSGGRAILGVGVGAVIHESQVADEETDLRTRAEMLDEGIDLIRALWTGQARSAGRHYRYAFGPADLPAVARPVQERVPIWVAAKWPRPKSMRRVLRCDGLIPSHEQTPEVLRQTRAWLGEQGARADLDILAEGETPTGDGVAAWDAVRPLTEAGCTWWLETRWGSPDDEDDRVARMTERIAAGPPRSPA